MGGWNRVKERSKELLQEYGWVFFATVFALWMAEWSVWVLAISLGFPVESLFASIGLTVAAEAQAAGIILSGFALTQVTKVPRLGVSFLITPFVARTVGRPRWVPPAP